MNRHAFIKLWWRFFWRYALIYTTTLLLTGVFLPYLIDSLREWQILARCMSFFSIISSSILAFVWLMINRQSRDKSTIVFSNFCNFIPYVKLRMVFFYFFRILIPLIFFIALFAFTAGFLAWYIVMPFNVSPEKYKNIVLILAYASNIPATICVFGINQKILSIIDVP